jgi:signal transduction histidine kinase
MPRVPLPRSLRAQLTVAFCAVTGLMFVAGVVAVVAKARVRSIVARHDAQAQIALSALRSQTELFMARRYEKDFFAKPKTLPFNEARDRYTSLVRTHEDNIHAAMAGIRSHTQSVSMRGNTEAIDRAIDASHAAFLRLVDLFEQRLAADSGLEARLTGTGLQILAAAQKSGDAKLIADAWELENDEKAFLLRPLNAEAAALIRGVVSLETDAAALGPRAAGLAEMAQAHAQLIEELLGLQRQIDTAWPKYVSLAEQSEPLFDALHDDAIAGQADAMRELQRSVTLSIVVVILAMVLACATGAAIAYLILRALSARIREFLGFAARIAGGEEDVRISGAGDDELGVLGGGLNQMADRLQAKHAELRRAQVALNAANEELEERVRLRTLEVVTKNEQLEREIAERCRAEEELRATHRKVVTLSRQAGMADIASSVLHNVGNVLNSVNISCEFLRGSFAQPASRGLSKINGLLSEQPDLPSFFGTLKGKQTVAYLQKLGGAVETENTACLKELATLGKHVEHIKAIVVRQQSHAKCRGLFEQLTLRELVEDGISFSKLHAPREAVTVVRDYCEDILVTTDRHKVSQILLNLLNNAREAAAGAARITVRTRATQDTFSVSVEDTGCGISADNLSRIFRHGFTTKEAGHGFGLHASACAATELHGSLKVESPGPGLGATFTLSLPNNAATAERASAPPSLLQESTHANV